ncbi:MAG: hypothetical protein KAV87_49425 [Desulfobacteraceae bacterium]|nr:hypothetical protein [Desulfobacteraceae bacterium]
MYNEGIRTFKAGEALAAKRRVKIESGTTNDPPEVVYADAGEDAIGVTEYAVADGDMIAIKMLNFPGTHEIECLVDSAIGRGTVLYAGDDGRVTDTSSGSAVGVSMVVGADNQHIEVVAWSLKSTTAATVSVADSGGLITAVTVEAALAEAFQHIQSAQKFIGVPLVLVFESDATNMTALTGATTPVCDMANGDTDSGVVLTWVASNSDAIIFQVSLPPDLDVASDVVIHFRAKSGGATDTPVIAADSYFNEGDTKIEDDAAALGAAYAEKTITIAAADVPAGAQTLTVELTPGAHTTDTIVLSSIWVEYTAKILTS